jgi:hypothetical protein
MLNRESKEGFELYFKALSPSRLWRLLYDANRQDTEGPLGFDCSEANAEPGYMRSMFHALNYMLETTGEPITAEYFERLRQKAIEFNLYFYLHIGLSKNFDKESAKNFGIGNLKKAGPNISVNGLRELVDKWKTGDDYIKIVRHTIGKEEREIYDAKHIPSDDTIEILAKRILSEKDWQVVLPVTDVKQINARIITIIAQYHNNIATAKNETNVIRAIATCIHELQLSHPFPDGNCRTFGLLGLNKLLIQNGLSLCIIENPNQFDLFSIDELCNQIMAGQKLFAAHQKLGNDEIKTECIYLENNPMIARLIARKVVTDCENWPKINEKEKARMIDLLIKKLTATHDDLPMLEIKKMISSGKCIALSSDVLDEIENKLMFSGALTSAQLNQLILALRKEVEDSIYEKRAWLRFGFKKDPYFQIQLDPKKMDAAIKKVITPSLHPIFNQLNGLR